MKHKTTGLARPCSAWDLFHVTGGLQCGNCLAHESRPFAPRPSRYRVAPAFHGEGATVFHVIDTAQPEREQPCVVHSFSTATQPHARYLAEDFCERHNLKG